MSPANSRKRSPALGPPALVLAVIGAIGGGADAWGAPITFNSAAGILFQGGAAAVDSSTIIATLVHGLTGSPFAVGAATAILRYGWLFSQIFVAYVKIPTD